MTAETCYKCNNIFLTESDTYKVIPTNEGVKYDCGCCLDMNQKYARMSITREDNIDPKSIKLIKKLTKKWRNNKMDKNSALIENLQLRVDVIKELLKPGVLSEGFEIRDLEDLVNSLMPILDDIFHDDMDIYMDTCND